MHYQPSLHEGIQPYPGMRLTRFLGRGGFAEVWEAAVEGGHPVALKFIRCDGGRAAQQEIRTLQALRSIRHPNLVPIERIWSYSTYLVIAMELAEGTLADVLALHLEEFGAALPARDVIDFLSPVADALDFLNARQHSVAGTLVAVQHCDVKPSNVLVSGGEVKLSDFGLSSLTTRHQHNHRRAGTPDFAAPEIFQGRLTDRADQYALAVTYYQMRTGKLPFSDTPPVFRSSYRRPRPELALLEPWERPSIARALAPAPQDRWPSCRELIRQVSCVRV